jgi:hypothetical protein
MVKLADDTGDSTDGAAATAPGYRSDSCLSKNCFRLSLLVICCILVFYSVVSTMNFDSLQQSLKQTVNIKSNTANDSDFGKVAFSMQRVEAGRTCFIHVGKTAGSLVRCILGIETPTCKPGSKNWKAFASERNVSVIAKHVDGSVVHMSSVSTGCRQNVTSFLVPTRNPVSRIQSWFNFEKPDPRKLPSSPNKLTILKENMKKLLFEECYDDLEEMALEGLSKNVSSEKIPANVSDMSCPQRAWAAITGARGFASHNRYNYEFYAAKMKSVAKSPTRTFVLRNEHLILDWNSVDDIFGGNGTAGYSLFGSSVNKGSTKQILSDPALEYLCRALCTENQYYKHMLLDAENLDSKQATMSILELKEVCRHETVEIRTCVGMPEFPRFKEPDWRP